MSAAEAGAPGKAGAAVQEASSLRSDSGAPPLYRQIASELRGQILSGRLAPGARLPSMRELQKRYAVSSLTARSALNLLRTEGLAGAVPGRGTFVTSPSPSPSEAAGQEGENRRCEQLEETLREVLGHLRPQGHPGWKLNTCLVTDEQLAKWWAALGAAPQRQPQ
ncbi:GntR family transcriptional regulator [Streptomyces sp. NPDC058861]|uniref:GntR family transcriptional regulator n=1 Tax=Streptomyces sp. NPDC058861 TaxID=3346653 RepID=UPI003695BDBE